MRSRCGQYGVLREWPGLFHEVDIACRKISSIPTEVRAVFPPALLLTYKK